MVYTIHAAAHVSHKEGSNMLDADGPRAECRERRLMLENTLLDARKKGPLEHNENGGNDQSNHKSECRANQKSSEMHTVVFVSGHILRSW